MTDAHATTPAAIDVDRAEAVTVRWEDGHVSRYALRSLREACPCAGCLAARQHGGGPTVPTPLSMVDMRLAGAWGMTPVWSDGHDTGIYAWSRLRARCPCAGCAAGGT